jgi:threonine/homoserine/homoserine lactone efflux protein
MTIDLLSALIAFAFVTSITPGPNNLMLMASGANFGFRRTVPHMLGVGIGFVAMVILVGLGIAGIFERWPASYTVLSVVSVLYMTWLAWKIANAAAPGTGDGAGKPFTFFQAAAFQWVNPKAWAMALTSVTVYAWSRDVTTIVAIAVIFGLVNIPSVGCWTLMGQGMRRWLSGPKRLKAFNWTMAALLMASLYPVLFP